MDASKANNEQTPSNFTDFVPERKLLDCFKTILKILQGDVFRENVGQSFKNTYAWIEESFSYRIKDLENFDYAVVVAGETGAGKSTLINTFIGNDISVEGEIETTNKIYRVQHSDKISAVTYRIGCVEPIERSFNSAGELRRMLKNEIITDNTINKVEALLLFPKIKNTNVTVVDTPAIGNYMEFRTMLMENVSEAVVFVIVIDASKAWESHRDRVLPLLTTIETASDMTCFDLENTLYVRNKWDRLHVGIQTQEEIKMKLTDQMNAEWPRMIESNIFDTCLKMNLNDDVSKYHSQFEKFEDTIHGIIKKKKSIRNRTQGKYLMCVVLKAKNGLSDALVTIKNQQDGLEKTCQIFNEDIEKTEQAIINTDSYVMANTNSPLKMANTNTPLKTIFRCEGSQSLRTEPHCFICLRSSSGKLRNIVTNVALPDNNPILKDIRKCLNMDSNAQFSIHECKICLTCKRHLENCVEFQNKLNEAIDRKSTSTCSTKRMAFSQTPSSSKKENVSDVSNKENIPARKVNCKKKKKLFLELDTDERSDVKKSDMCQSDHNYGSFASPVDMAHINSVRAKQELFCKKNHQDQCYSADDIFKNKILLSEVQKLILLETEVVADKLCSLSIQPGPSVLRTLQHPSSLKSEDILHKCLLEFQNCFPFVFRVFQTLASPLHADQQRTNTCNSTIAMMYAMAMNRRNKDLCAMQKINTCIALRFHAGNDLLDIFNKTSITLSADSKYTFLDKMGDLNTEGIVRSVQMGIGGKVTVDNIDGMTIARDVRLTGGNKHYHYTASTYYPDRADLTDLEESTTLTPPEEINFDVFYLSAEEESRLKEMYGYMVGRTLVKYFPAMKWMEPCIPSHIPHQYSQQMESKSQIFPLKEMNLKQLK